MWIGTNSSFTAAKRFQLWRPVARWKVGSSSPTLISFVCGTWFPLRPRTLCELPPEAALTRYSSGRPARHAARSVALQAARPRRLTSPGKGGTRVELQGVEVLAEGLLFPEGPVAM